MTRLILIRHAKSGWDDPFADDHERTLTERGQADARCIGAWLQRTGYVPELILCSDAARTIETCDYVVPAFATKPKVKLDKYLYHASPDTILEQVKRENASVIAVIAHNPGLGMLADGLVAQRPDHHRFRDYPTCATTIIDFEGEIGVAKGTCVDFVTPNDLRG